MAQAIKILVRGLLFISLFCLWGIAACSRISTVREQPPSWVTQKAHLGWEEGIEDLVLQVINRLPAGEILTVQVGDFMEGRSGGRVSLSDLIESDIRTTMAMAEDIKVLELGQTTSGLLLTGLFRMDGDILRINAALKDMKTGAIRGAGRVLIKGDGIHDKDLLPAKTLQFPPIQKGDEVELPFDVAVEQVLTIENSTNPFHVRIWTEKNHFRIGDPVTLYLKADRDCYVTLLDIGTSGTLRVLFPNPYQRDNFIHGGKTYIIPDPAIGYEVRVDGPPGIERVKAIASLMKPQIPVDVSERFYELNSKDGIRLRDLTLSIKRLDERQWTQSLLDIDIVDSEGKDAGRPRRLKPKRPDKPVDIIGTPGLIEKESPGVIEPRPPMEPVDILGVPGAKPEDKREGN